MREREREGGGRNLDHNHGTIPLKAGHAVAIELNCMIKDRLIRDTRERESQGEMKDIYTIIGLVLCIIIMGKYKGWEIKWPWMDKSRELTRVV